MEVVVTGALSTGETRAITNAAGLSYDNGAGVSQSGAILTMGQGEKYSRAILRKTVENDGTTFTTSVMDITTADVAEEYREITEQMFTNPDDDFNEIVDSSNTHPFKINNSTQHFR